MRRIGAYWAVKVAAPTADETLGLLEDFVEMFGLCLQHWRRVASQVRSLRLFQVPKKGGRLLMLSDSIFYPPWWG